MPDHVPVRLTLRGHVQPWAATALAVLPSLVRTGVLTLGEAERTAAATFDAGVTFTEEADGK